MTRLLRLLRDLDWRFWAGFAIGGGLAGVVAAWWLT